MIPKTIHYCWFGPARRNRSIKRCMASWSAVLPDYTIREWNESNLPPANPYLREVYAKGLWSKVSNYVRLHALLVEGGVYLDTDVEVVRRLDPLLNHGCFIGFQQEEAREDWVNNAIMGARPGHPFTQACLDVTTSAFEARGEILRSPQVATSVLREMGLTNYGLQTLSDVTVYPSEYFSPYPWHAQFSPDCVTERTYTIHRWEGSWLARSRRARAVDALRAARNRLPAALQFRELGRRLSFRQTDARRD